MTATTPTWERTKDDRKPAAPGRGKTILIVEDESDAAELLRYSLEREGHQVRRAPDGHSALVEARRSPPDLVLLDRMLPGISGDEVLSQLKRDTRTARIPVIMLTAKAEETDELVGFALGADDYIAKPFSVKLLLARISAVFRRSETTDEEAEVITQGPVTLDRGRHEVTVGGEVISLTATEFRLLGVLMSGKGRVMERTHLVERVMGTEVAVTDRTIDVHITALRRKLKDAATWIQTIRGVGYTFRQPD
jgi:two-component system phosphate regulon response regulator PhoB